jgi:uncharacterized protein YjbI with pentapeptide repeats
MAVHTLNTEQEDRWQTIKQIWQANHWLYGVMGFLLGLLAFPALRMVVDDAAELASGLVPETVGIVITVLFIERLNERRENQRRKAEQNALLIRQASSPVNDVAVNAINEIRRLGLLSGKNGILQGADLSGADLQGAMLTDANLQSANLSLSNLQRVNLVGADLRGANLSLSIMESAYLYRAKLQGANLEIVNLELANLTMVDLQDANLYGASLQGANLSLANLKGANLLETSFQNANLSKAAFSVTTILPDQDTTPFGDLFIDKYYRPGNTDMTRYTDPKHPDFWQRE